MQGPIARQDGLDGMTVIAAVLLVAALVMIGPDGRSRMLEKVWAYIPGGVSEQQPASAIDVPPVVVDEPAPDVPPVEAPAVRAEEQAAPGVTLQADTGELETALEAAKARANESGKTVNVEHNGVTYSITPDPVPGRYEAAPKKEAPVLNATAGGRVEQPEPPVQAAPPQAPPPAPRHPKPEPWQQNYNAAIQQVVPGFEIIPQPAPAPPANPAPIIEAVQGATQGDFSGWQTGLGNLGLEGAAPAECGVNVSCVGQ